MNTTTCRRCGATITVCAKGRIRATAIDGCEHCNRPAKPMTWTLEARATRTQFAPARKVV